MKFKLVESLLEDLDSNRRALLKKFNDDESIVNYIMKIDPSVQVSRKPDTRSSARPRPMIITFRGEGKFLPWLGKIYQKNGNIFNNEEKLEIALKYFYQQSNQFENKDINQFKTEEDLITTVGELISNGKSDYEIKINNIEKNMSRGNLPYPDFDIKKAKEGINLVYHDKDWLVYVPENYEASVVLRGQNAEWCTGWHENNKRMDAKYNEYTEDGSKLYIIINKQNPDEKYQVCIHPDGSWQEFNNAGNISLNDDELEEFFDVNEGLCNFFGKLTMYNLCIPKKTRKKTYIYDGIQPIPKLIEKVIVKDNVTRIKSDVFYSCNSLKSIIIPDSVIEIEDGAFKNCQLLESITIPNSITEIKNNTFELCTSLKSIIIPNSVTKIGDNAFKYCSSLESITFEEPCSLTEIGEFAFYLCISLKSIIIPNSVNCIASKAFENCKTLNSITILSSKVVFSGDPFEGCSNLTVKTSNKYVQDHCDMHDIKWEPIE